MGLSHSFTPPFIRSVVISSCLDWNRLIDLISWLRSEWLRGTRKFPIWVSISPSLPPSPSLGFSWVGDQLSAWSKEGTSALQMSPSLMKEKSGAESRNYLPTSSPRWKPRDRERERERWRMKGSPLSGSQSLIMIISMIHHQRGGYEKELPPFRTAITMPRESIWGNDKPTLGLTEAVCEEWWWIMSQPPTPSVSSHKYQKRIYPLSPLIVCEWVRDYLHFETWLKRLYFRVRLNSHHTRTPKRWARVS